MPVIHTVIINSNSCIKNSTNTFHHRFIELGVINRRVLFSAQDCPNCKNKCSIPPLDPLQPYLPGCADTGICQPC